jgi:hypothetical protein
MVLTLRGLLNALKRWGTSSAWAIRVLMLCSLVRERMSEASKVANQNLKAEIENVVE